MEAVAVCDNCLRPVGPEQVQKVQKVPDQWLRILIYHCVCGEHGQVGMNDLDYRRFVGRWENYRKQGKTKVTKTYDPEKVGIQVAGFRIDLATIDTVDDLIMEWRATVPPMEKTVRLGGR